MSGAQTSSFANVLFDPLMARKQTEADIANQYAPARNQLYLDVGAQKLEEGRQGIDFARQKNPLEILQMRQQLGLDPSPALEKMQQTYAGGGVPGLFEQKLGGAESGNDPTKVNHGGFSGQFQMGKERMADLGFYTPAPGEDMKSPDWSGKVSVAPYAVSNRDEFLKSPAAQHAVFGAHVADIDKAIAATPGADQLDANGLRAVAHLGGVEGMRKFISTRGQYNPADANGTKLSDYYVKFATGGAPALQQAFGSPHGPAGPPAAPGPAPYAPPAPPGQLAMSVAPGGGVAGRTPGAVDVAGPGAPSGPAPVAPDQTAPVAPTAQTPATGLNSPQVQQAQVLLRRAAQIEMQAARYPNDPRMKATATAMAQDLKSRAAVMMQADSVSYDPTTGIGTKALSGERVNAAQPLAHYVWNGRAYEDTSGAHPPVTPPSPRLTNVEGVGVVQSDPGGGAKVVVPMNPAGMATQKAAEAQGTNAGAAAGKSVKEMADLTRSSAQAVGNIDYGVSQLDKARDGGINTGYFSGALAGVQSALKSLGLPTDKIPFINVSPDAIGNIQTARKTLAVVSGAILQQIIGRDSSITDAKIEAFIHAQPDITGDPQAVRRVLNWARSQFVYENELGKAGMQAASDTGMVPLNFLPKYISEHGGGPVYDPLTGEMQQPDGRTPSREPPAAASGPVTVKSDADYHELKSGQTFTGPDGKVRRKP